MTAPVHFIYEGIFMTQRDRIKNYLIEFGSITNMEAVRDLGIMRLSARIVELERQGIRLDHKTEYSQNRYGEKVHYTRYFLVSDPL